MTALPQLSDYDVFDSIAIDDLWCMDKLILSKKLGYTCVDVTGRWFASTITNKILHCDYVSTMKPPKNAQAISENRLDRMINDLELNDIRINWDRLMFMKLGN